MADDGPKPGRGRARGPAARGRSQMSPGMFPQAGRVPDDAQSIASVAFTDDGTSTAGSTSTYGGAVTESLVSELHSTRLDAMSSRGSVGSDGPTSVTSHPGSGSGGMSGRPGVVRTLKPGFNKHGSDGQEVDVVTNYYIMNQRPDFAVYQYMVDFTPKEDSTKFKKAFLRQHEKDEKKQDKLGPYIFDGSLLYKSTLVQKEHLNLTAVKEDSQEKFQISLRLVGQVNPEDAMFLQFYNIVMRKAMNILGMEEMGRHLYDRHSAIKFKEDRLELWPGFITAIRNHEAGTLLCVEVTHKVLRTMNVWDLMRQLNRPGISEQEYEKTVRAEIEDSIVMTHYNRRTYKIDNIDFKTTPASSFRDQDGKVQTYAKYYKDRYAITIPEDQMCQPMLVSIPKKKDLNKGVTGEIYLIPSLCNPTGLTDGMRKNFQLMKRLSAHLHMNPNERKAKLDEFMGKLTNTPEVRREFASWDVEFNPKPLDSKARIFPREKIVVSPEERGPIDVDEKGDWTRGLKGRRVLKPEHLRDWIAFCPRNDLNGMNQFIGVLKRMGGELGIEVATPKEIVGYDVGRNEERVLTEARRTYGSGVNFVFYVLPNNQLRRYADVKNFCSLQWGVACQCFLAKNMNNKTLNSICTKVMIQVTAKLGGIPWSIKIPIKKLMVMGFDVYHCSARKGESAGGLVATSSPSLTSYISVVSFHKDKSELSSNMCTDVSTCLQEYSKVNGYLPEKIIMYRDGVGEGQVEFVLNSEVEQVRQAIRDIYNHQREELPKLSFIIVTKKINSRAFLAGRNGRMDNLPVGTVMDKTFTLPERYDFFLVSQDVRQGTVSPTNYHVVFDESDMPADRMQRLAYKMCHLYFNWSGTVAVPAPCQYAHKLAYLTGVAVNDKVKEGLYSKLWYL